MGIASLGGGVQTVRSEYRYIVTTEANPVIKVAQIPQLSHDLKDDGNARTSDIS